MTDATTAAAADPGKADAKQHDSSIRTAGDLPLPFTHILHPTDLNPDRLNAYYHAVKLGLASRSRLDLLHVMTLEQRAFPSVRKTLADWKCITLDDPTMDLCDTGLSPQKHSVSGGLIPVITGAVKGGSFDLLVLSTHNYAKRSKSFVGSKAEIVSRRSQLPTLFIPRESRGFVEAESGKVNLKKILLPVAERPHPQLAITKLASLLNCLQVRACEVRLLFVGKKSKFPRVKIFKGEGVKWAPMTRFGALTDSILGVCNAWRPDLVVMPTSSNLRKGDSVFASQTERVLRECGCPLLSFPTKC